MRKPTRRSLAKTSSRISRKNRKLKCEESASEKPVEEPVVEEPEPVNLAKPVEPIEEQAFHEARRRYTYRVLPTETQRKELDSLLEGERRLYNFGRQYCADIFLKTGEIPTAFDLDKMLPVWQEDNPSLGSVTRRIQRGTLRRLPQAFEDCRRHKRKIDKLKKQGKRVKREPRLVPKYKDKEDFRSIVVTERVRVVEDKLYIPRLEAFRIRRKGGNPYPQGTPCTVTLTKKYGRWYASIAFKVRVPTPKDNGEVLGVDRNVRQVVDSKGHLHAMPDVGQLEAKVARLERKAARGQKGSNRRRRLHIRIGRLKTRIARIKHNHNHHVSKDLAARAGTIVLEKLHIRGMMASARGTLESPGRNVKQKTGLNRGIQGTNWYQLEGMIKYKTHKVLHVEPAYTSQTCHACGHRSEKNRKSQAVFECVECGHEDNADINAALNIRRLGLAQLHGEKCSL